MFLFSQPLFKVPLEEYVFRSLNINDYEKGFVYCLEQLTTVGSMSCEQFKETFQSLINKDYYIIVIEHISTQKIVGCGTLFVEQKFIHSSGKVGHVEDVVVLDSQRGKQLGKW